MRVFGLGACGGSCAHAAAAGDALHALAATASTTLSLLTAMLLWVAEQVAKVESKAAKAKVGHIHTDWLTATVATHSPTV